MVNTCELSNERCYANKPKVLIGLGQKGNVVGTGAEVSPVMGINTTGEKREPTPSIGSVVRNTVSP